MIHLESNRIGMKIETEMRRGKSFFDALASASKDASVRQERLNKKPPIERTFDGLSESQMRDVYFHYAAYRDEYCKSNETCRAEFGIIEFYFTA